MKSTSDAPENQHEAPNGPQSTAAAAASPPQPTQEEQPQFRFTKMRSQTDENPTVRNTGFALQKPPPVASIGVPRPARIGSNDVIDVNEYFASAQRSTEDSESSLLSGSASNNWTPMALRPVPAFYPLEKSTRLVEDENATDVATRLAECLRYLSVQADYNNESATASLLTCENVEMHLSLWKTPNTAQQQGVLVELQRRKGDSMVFHRYARHILDAAVGVLDIADIPDDLLDDKMYSKKVQRLLSLELQNQENQEHENAIIALEIAHGLLMKDRMDARQLGLESLCLLTDPRKTGFTTAVLTSHVVLLGSTQGVHVPGVSEKKPSEEIMMDEGPFQEICEAILSLVQFSRIGEDEVDEADIVMSPDSEQMTLLHNLALAVLANALDVVEHPERYEGDPEDTKPRARVRTASSTEVANEFLQQTEDVSNTELLSTLISELGKAQHKPHNATLSAKCLGSLCRASDEAKRRAKELGAKTVVSTALDVGVRTHLKLETECKKVVEALEQVGTDDQQQQQPRLRRDENL